MDWITDPDMSAAETVRRFAELHPEPTIGPRLAVRDCRIVQETQYAAGVLVSGLPG